MSGFGKMSRGNEAFAILPADTEDRETACRHLGVEIGECGLILDEI